MRSTWKPWKDADVIVHSLLISPSQRWPDWHVRIHRLENKGTSDLQIRGVQGGFSTQGRENKLGGVLPSFTEKSDAATNSIFTSKSDAGFFEGTQETSRSALVCSNAGCSGISNIDSSKSLPQQRKGQVLKPDSNTNLMWQRTLIPTLESTATLSAGTSTTLQSAVFAIARREGFENECGSLAIEERWADMPQTLFSDSDELSISDCILIPQNW